jgi:hypothetical protein
MGKLRAGPLSLVGEGAGSAQAQTTAGAHGGGAGAAHRIAPVPRTAALPPGDQALPERFVLQVDGAGAFLVVRSPAVKVGPISSSVLPDVALIAEATAPAVTIERVEDDYFLRAASPVWVNEKPATDALLGTGDRVTLSPRCRFAFALPHPASTTAVLDLVGARYPRGDVRRVILLDRDLVLGPSAASHVRVGGLPAPVVLHLRGGVLRASVEATVDGKPVAREAGLPVGVPVSAGGASFVISRL